MRPRGTAWIPLLAGLIVALVGTLGIWLVGSPIESDGCPSLDLYYQEGKGVSTHPGFTPPTTYDCEIHARGERRTETVFPGFSYLLWLYFSATIALAVWIAVEPRARVLGIAVGGMLLVGALVVLAFFNPAISASVAAVTIAACLAVSLARRPREPGVGR